VGLLSVALYEYVFPSYLLFIIFEGGTSRDLLVLSGIAGVFGISRSRGYKHRVSGMGNDI
jgi:hypothetical protein